MLMIALTLKTFPFFGIEPVVISEEGKELEGPCEGYLVGIDALEENCGLILIRPQVTQMGP